MRHRKQTAPQKPATGEVTGAITALVVSFTTPDGDVHGFTLSQMAHFMRPERYAELLDGLAMACEHLLAARRERAQAARFRNPGV
jgi:hypothetical protein